MKKPADLRQHLIDAIPHVRKHPDKLQIYIERGAIAARMGGSLSFEYRYDVVLLFLDYAEHADSLMVPLLAWIAVHQPGLLLNPDSAAEAIKFKAEILDAKTADIEITLALTEAVRVTPAPGAAYTATHLPEPPLLDLGGERNWEIFINGVPLGEA